MTDVWPLLAPWRTCFARYWLTPLVGPAYVAPTLSVVNNAQWLVGTQAPQSRALTRSAKRLSPCLGWPTWLCVTGRDIFLGLSYLCTRVFDQWLGLNVAYASLFAFKLSKTRASNHLFHHPLKLLIVSPSSSSILAFPLHIPHLLAIWS